MNGRSRTVAGRVVDFLALTERRRLLVVAGVPAAFLALFELLADFGALTVALAVGLVAFLYTRGTTQRTLAAAVYGVGLLFVALFALDLYWNWARGSTEPLVGTATRLGWRAAVGTALFGVGVWLRRTDLA